MNFRSLVSPTPEATPKLRLARLVVSRFLTGSFLLVAALSVSSQTQAQTLAWSPPSGYSSYTAATASSSTANLRTYNLAAGNWKIDLASGTNPTAPVQIIGGDNVVIIGGNIEVPQANNGIPGDSYRRAIYIKDGSTSAIGRVVHIEGVQIKGAQSGSNYLTCYDGIALNCPTAIVQIENCNIEGVRGFKKEWPECSTNPYPLIEGANNTVKDWHGDVIQPWGGAKEIRVDRLFGTTDYQGLFLKADSNTIERVALRNINIIHMPPPTGLTNHLGYMLWRTGRNTVDPITFDKDTKAPFSATISNLKIQLRAGANLLNSTNPDGDFQGYNESDTSSTPTPEPEIDLWRGVLSSGTTSTVMWKGVGSASWNSSVTLTSPASATPGTSYSAPGYTTTPINTALSPSPVVTTGTASQIFVCVYSHSQGVTNVENAYFLVGPSSTSAADTVIQVKYNAATNLFSLASDTGTFGTPGAGPYTNSRGTIERYSSYTSGKDRIVKWKVTPSTTFTGDKLLYLKSNQGTYYSSFEERGIWRIKSTSGAKLSGSGEGF